VSTSDLTYARARFAWALGTLTAGAVLTVGAFTFASPTLRWLGFGIGCAVLLALAAAFAVAGRGTIQRILDLPLALVCGWAIVCSRVVEHDGAGASPTAVKWFSFAAGAAICTLGAIGLLLHELGVERDLRWAERYVSADARTAGR